MEVAAPREGIVWFNVGGKRFATTLSTLRSRGEDNLLVRLATSQNVGVMRDEQGAIFIDRSPKLFARVLDYLRGEELDASHRTELLTEMRFYSIEGVLSAGVSDVSLCETIIAARLSLSCAVLAKYADTTRFVAETVMTHLHTVALEGALQLTNEWRIQGPSYISSPVFIFTGMPSAIASFSCEATPDQWAAMMEKIKRWYALPVPRPLEGEFSFLREWKDWSQSADPVHFIDCGPHNVEWANAMVKMFKSEYQLEVSCTLAGSQTDQGVGDVVLPRYINRASFSWMWNKKYTLP